MCVYKQKITFYIVYLVLGSTIPTDTTLKVRITAPTTVTTKSTTTTEKAFTATKTTVDMDSSKIQTSVSGDKGMCILKYGQGV